MQDELKASLPPSVDAERTILGAMLLDRALIPEVREMVVADDFSIDSHRKIYSCILELFDRFWIIDLRSLRHILESRKEISAAGGVEYLAALTKDLALPTSGELIRVIDLTTRPRRLAASRAPLLTLLEASEILRFHVKTVRRMATQKKIPAVRFGHVWRFDAAVLRQWFADQSKQSARIPRIWDK